MMNGYNATLRTQRTQARPVFVRDPKVSLPDTVGRFRSGEMRTVRVLTEFHALFQTGETRAMSLM